MDSTAIESTGLAPPLMHDTAQINAQAFVDQYCQSGNHVLEIGPGSDTTICAMLNHCVYHSTELDADPYHLPYNDGTFDAIICSSVYEHMPWFWEHFVQCQRVLKSGGFMYIQVPANGPVHRFPVDCWRFYPDSGLSLTTYAQHRGYACDLIKTETTPPRADIWYDHIIITQKQ